MVVVHGQMGRAPAVVDCKKKITEGVSGSIGTADRIHLAARMYLATRSPAPLSDSRREV